MNPRLVWLALITAALRAQPAGAPYVPDLKLWRLELSSPAGGWLTEPRQDITFKLVDPQDPAPPRDGPDAASAYDDAERFQPTVAKTPGQLRQEALRAEADRLANLWRHRTIAVWFNGEPLPQPWVDVNTTRTFRVVSRNGENRLELLEPESGARATRTWWVSTSRDRLRVFALRDSFGDGSWLPGDLQVLEPDGATARFGRTPSGGKAGGWEYTHAAPPPGTYTVRWSPSPWQPIATVTVEAVLDGGTDRERHWRFNRLILPGTPPMVFGTFDVDP